MNTLQEYYNFLDNSKLDCNSGLEIKLYNLYNIYMQKDDQENAFLCELERRILLIKKSFDYKINIEEGTVDGLSYMFSIRPEDGSETPIYYPDVTKLTKPDFEYCEKRYKECQSLFIKKEYGLMVYFGKQTDYSKCNDFKSQLCNELFTLAKDYLAEIINDCENKQYNIDFFPIIKLAFGVAANNKLIREIKTLVEFVFETHQNSDINKNGMIKIILDSSCFISDNFNSFKKFIDFNKVIEKDIEVIKGLEKKDLLDAKYLVDIVLRMQQQMKCISKNMLRYKAEIYEKLMKDGEENRKNNFIAVSFAKDALEVYKSLKDKDKIEELSKKYNDLRGKIQLTERFCKFPKEHIQQEIERVNAIVKQSTEQEVIYYFITTPWYMKIDDVDAGRTRDFGIPVCIIDKFGNLIKTCRTESEINEHNFWELYTSDKKIKTQIMHHLFIQAYKAGKLNYQSVIDYLETTWINEPIVRNYSKTVEIKPIDTIKPCLKRLFSELELWFQDENYHFDCVTITDSVVPKVEQLLRNLCERIEIPIFKPQGKRSDLFMEKSSGDLLADLKHSTEKKTSFDEEDRIFIKYVLIEKSGLNLRNKVAHGLMDINEYSCENILLLFCIIMKLSKYKICSNKLVIYETL